ncbi:flagellar hook-length control protein FliK [Burkholderiaceae bacterium DAT-1]|nr:flagellar hook-length control protein FliK [Burkholderiaceae bacterium DAT-1]
MQASISVADGLKATQTSKAANAAFKLTGPQALEPTAFHAQLANVRSDAARNDTQHAPFKSAQPVSGQRGSAGTPVQANGRPAAAKQSVEQPEEPSSKDLPSGANSTSSQHPDEATGSHRSKVTGKSSKVQDNGAEDECAGVFSDASFIDQLRQSNGLTCVLERPPAIDQGTIDVENPYLEPEKGSEQTTVLADLMAQVSGLATVQVAPAQTVAESSAVELQSDVLGKQSGKATVLDAQAKVTPFEKMREVTLHAAQGDGMDGAALTSLPTDMVNRLSAATDQGGALAATQSHTLSSVQQSNSDLQVDAGFRATLSMMQQRGASAAVTPKATALDSQIAVPVGAEGWGQAIGQRVLMQVGEGRQQVEMQLNPLHLGPVSVKLSLEGNQASLTFVAAHESVQAALNAALPQLNHMLGDSGIQLAQAQVQLGQGQSQQQDQSDRQAGRRNGQGMRDDGVESAEASVRTRMMTIQAPGNVNLFV